VLKSRKDSLVQRELRAHKVHRVSLALRDPLDRRTIAGTLNRLVKFTGATNGGDSQISDNGTNVGIATTTPGVKLDVVGTVNTSTQYNMGRLRVVGA
jgi:hypothetical protein